jgi:hypothetical protein
MALLLGMNPISCNRPCRVAKRLAAAGCPTFIELRRSPRFPRRRKLAARSLCSD